MSLNDLARQINDNARAKGFWDDAERNMGEMLMLAVSELADCIIRCLDTMHSLGVDIDGVVARKMAYNASRPHKHGKAY